MDKFSNRLKKALEFNNMKPIELADKLKINKGIISNYINDKYKPKYDRITDIARILNVNEAWLMGYDIVMDRSLSAEELYIEITKLVAISNIQDKDKNRIIKDIEFLVR